jgi:hypothetical protein
MRADLRLKDLQGRERTASKLMNVKVPARVINGIQKIAKQLGVSKTDVVIALLNEGLDLTTQQLKGWKPPKIVSPPAVSSRPKRLRSVKGCGKAHLAKGFCRTHYQAARYGKKTKKTAAASVKAVKSKSKRRAS